mmetsp:Transcript_73566/g.206558  ORF Transcript_73566/g.206558 Transcript_73566/m.206558 type:complete len:201 (-) Transcript_73566:3-605(-)
MRSYRPRFLVKASKPGAISEPMPEVCVSNCRTVMGSLACWVASFSSPTTRGHRNRSATGSGRCRCAGSSKCINPRSTSLKMPTPMNAFVIEYNLTMVSLVIAQPRLRSALPALCDSTHLSNWPSPVNAQMAKPGQRPFSTMASISARMSSAGKPSATCCGKPPNAPWCEAAIAQASTTAAAEPSAAAQSCSLCIAVAKMA